MEIGNNRVHQTTDSLNQIQGSSKQIKGQVKENDTVQPKHTQKINPIIDKDLVIEQKKNEDPILEKALIDAIQKMDKELNGPTKRFEYAIHKATHEIMIKILNNDTGEVIVEINPEKTLDRLASLLEMAGIIVDEKR